ncbi:cytochrome C oxidase subunit IV family protein [Nibrella viscosa]|uniref:cytochrome C oxidase subunit IV family protein n=1 Tax=Nibrella viscosa TaxID=1084524 RepID=UPI0031EA8036
MAGHHNPEFDNHSGTDVNPPQTAIIWRTFWILAGITALEFLIAFTMPAGTLRIAIFCGMTIVKAFYIVGEFMHLKHEVKSLIWSILLPCLFVVWLLVALLVEGGSIFGLR